MLACCSSSGLQRQQRVDEEAIAARRRHPAGRRVRARDEAQVLEIRHDVADRRRRQLQARQARQRARPDRLAVGDVVLDQGLEQCPGAFVQHGEILRRLCRPQRAERSSESWPAGWTVSCIIEPCPRPFGMSRSSASRARKDIREPLLAIARIVEAAGARVLFDLATAEQRRSRRRRTPDGARDRQAGGRRRRAGRRRHDARHCARTGAVPGAADRHQPRPARVHDRHRAGPDGRDAAGRCWAAATKPTAGSCSMPKCAAPGRWRITRWRSTTSSFRAA